MFELEVNMRINVYMFQRGNKTIGLQEVAFEILYRENELMLG